MRWLVLLIVGCAAARAASPPPRLAIRPCPVSREVGGATIVGGTRAETIEWMKIATLASGEAVAIGDLVDRSNGYHPRRDVWWWQADGACRWRATLDFDATVVAADGPRAWLGPYEIDRDGRVLRHVELPRYLQQLTVAPGGLAAIVADATATELWRLDGARWSLLAHDPVSKRASAAAASDGAVATLFHFSENQTGQPPFARLTVFDRAGKQRASTSLGPGYGSSALAADGDGWLVAAVTPSASASWTPPQPPQIEIAAFDRALARRWQLVLPATAPWTIVSEVRRDGDDVIVELAEQIDRWRRRTVVLDAATGTPKPAAATSSVWTADLVSDGDQVGGARLTTERWTEQAACMRNMSCIGGVYGYVVTTVAAAIRRSR